jgi:uncharacterized protein YjgD (DUF1641 family)
MDGTDTEIRMDAVETKLDLILEEINRQRAHRREMEDPKDDLMRVGNDLFQPDLLRAVDDALAIYKNMDLEVEDKVSLLTLLKELSAPEARKGMAFAFRILRSIASHNKTPGINR